MTGHVFMSFSLFFFFKLEKNLSWSNIKFFSCNFHGIKYVLMSFENNTVFDTHFYYHWLARNNF